MPRLTVFTPTYNRAHTLPRTYASLSRQDCKDFVWLIIDDGSTDDTRALVKAWQTQEHSFEIRYLYKGNGGMHTAHNAAYEVIDTELNVCIDSDDCLAPGAVRKILAKWDSVQKDKYAGIIGLDADLQGNLIGTGFPAGMIETTLSGYYAAGGSGDKKLVYRTDVMRQYPPYPVFEGEKYVALAYKYRLIDQDYKLAVLNEILCNVEYQQDGSSNTMWRQYLNNPKGFAFWRKVCMQYPISRKRLFIDCVHYISSSILAGDRFFLFHSPRKAITATAILPGALLSFYTRRKASEQGK